MDILPTREEFNLPTKYSSDQEGLDILGFHQLTAAKKISPLKKYQALVIGNYSLWQLIKYEVFTSFLGPLPGVLGIFLRQKFYKRLFRKMGPGVIIGQNVTLRHPSKISIGNNSIIDDYCVLSLRGSADMAITIGENVFIGRSTIINTRNGTIEIDNYADIGSNCRIASASRVKIGKYVLIAAFCYIGGANHSIKRTDIPIAHQEMVDKGGVIIEDDVWLGADVKVNDGVIVGQGAVIGAGSVVTKDIPPYSIAYGLPAKVVGSRKS
jgi:acetyltransferase-like isoleucine patch superfamily enzyme